MENMIEIPYKEKGRKARGEDGYKYTSIRLKDQTIAALDALAAKSNRSRNEIITALIEAGLKNARVTGI